MLQNRVPREASGQSGVCPTPRLRYAGRSILYSPMVNKIGGSYLSSFNVAVGVKRHSINTFALIARPCTGVRVLSLHSHFSMGLFQSLPCGRQGNPRPFGFGVSVRISRLAADGRYPLLLFVFKRNSVFGLSSPVLFTF